MKNILAWLRHAVPYILFAIAAIMVWHHVHAEGHPELLVTGKSWHFGRTDGYTYPQYNQYNPGLGIEYRWDNGFFVGGMSYYDSYRKQAYAAYGGYQYTVPVTGNWSVFAAARAGYLNGSGMHGPVIIPSVGVQYKRVSVEATLIPKIRKEDVNVIGLMARWRF